MSSEPVLPNDKLVRIFIKIRDAKTVLKRESDAAIDKLDQQLKTISAEIKARCIATGTTGFKTDDGTVYISETLKATCGDWGVFHAWIKENDKLDFLEQRVKAGEVKKYMEDNAGELPPGISVFRETEARVRRPKEKSTAGEESEAS